MSAAAPAAGPRRRRMSRLRLREAIDGYICIAPWVLGFIIFTAFPIIASFVLSFSRYTILDAPRFIGLANYTKMVSGDPLFWQSLKVTVIYTVLLVPLGTVGGYLLALLLNQAVQGLGFFRPVFYLPVVTPAIATSTCLPGCSTRRSAWSTTFWPASTSRDRSGSHRASG